MKTKSYSESEERRILTAMVVHDGVLGTICGNLGADSKPFPNKWSNTVAEWCLDYYSKYQRAPGPAIEPLFEEYASRKGDDASVPLIEKLLGSLSDEYKARSQSINEDHLVDVASNYFEKVRLTKLQKDLDAALEKNDLERAKEAYTSFEKVSFAGSDWKDPLSDEFINHTFQREERDILIRLPGDMNRFLSPQLERHGFIVFVGPEKVGKSWWLNEMVFRAHSERRRVDYYCFGDMAESEVGERILIRAARWPLEKCELRSPKAIHHTDRKNPIVDFEAEQIERGLSAPKARKIIQELLMKKGMTKSRIRLKCAGGYEMTASAIENETALQAKKGNCPDVIVIDYLDLLAPEPSTKHMDLRHQINMSWMILRRIALKYHCLVIGATQAAATAYDSWVITNKDFSDDKRKNAHVTGMIGINQTPKEKEQQIYRLNWVAVRRAKWTVNQCLWTAGELGIGCPCIISSL